ncbi:MAG: redox-regulated ATPase YchF [Deltaproteobacteria bacterium]|nr:redox-regulated ATPase YchF [Deltaproteobacteria bacterium]
MKVGIIGLPQTGKKTLFHILTGTRPPEQTDLKKPLMGTADIKDLRFDTLVDMYAPQKNVRAKVDLALLPKLEKEAIAQGDIFKDIVDMDAICHVVRAFEDEAVYHVDGSVDPLRDIESIHGELILHDLLFLETRLERIESNLKKLKDEKQQKEKVLLETLKAHLEDEKPLRLMDLAPNEELLIRSYPFITRKEMILVLNIADDGLDSDGLIRQLTPHCMAEQVEVMQVSAQVEAEIAALDSEAERLEFLQELGIKEPALGQLTGLCLNALGLQSFFTVGKDEVRQWLLKKNASAPEAAGTIHSDLQRGFIRAETMKYDELMAHKDEAGLKAAGKIYLKGKDYLVEDGDILNIRFKV